ncbi:hypothetical protein RCL_jg4321.t1 [Rhizophagus clarus]|uniref:Uncharacterized protein n=1 Tax=Rhizophagus clarus TaxID=94130 RepID=A0A8H3QCI4_9GLOM|nr:hypothetical protein RCL_jg4321.t1 [Rhizophagus clarus]
MCRSYIRAQNLSHLTSLAKPSSICKAIPALFGWLNLKYMEDFLSEHPKEPIISNLRSFYRKLGFLNNNLQKPISLG